MRDAQKLIVKEASAGIDVAAAVVSDGVSPTCCLCGYFEF